MPFDPGAWLGVADVCRGAIPGTDQQALFRTALNRAYYAALLSLKRRIEGAQGDGTVPKTRTHEALLQAIATGGDEFKLLHKELKRLQKARNSADYELQTGPFAYDGVLRTIDRSKRVVWNILRPMPDAAFKKLKVPRYD